MHRRVYLAVQGFSRRGLAAALLAALWTGAAPAAETGSGANPRIVNGLDSHDFPTTGALLYSQGGNITANNAGSWCSGTLIGCRTFLTAAHCVDGDTAAGHYWVYLQHGGIFTVSSITMHSLYLGNTADVAVVKLTNQVTGIDPTPINTIANPSSQGFGLDGRIAGFGQTLGSGNDYGIKRQGLVDTATCDPVATGGTNTDWVCWNYSNPIGAPGADSNTCNGDSGGPLFLDLGTGFVVAGITSAGTNANCSAGDHSWDANVYTYRSFINTQLGTDPTGVCGSLPAVGDASVDVFGNSGELSGGHVSDTFTVNVAGGTSAARFALNGEDNGTFNVDFYVKAGAGVSTADYDCKSDGTSNFGACIISSPAAGQWSVLVRRAAGAGQYQLTTTLFDGDPPVCGNDLQESGEECDGSDDEACAGMCSGACACPQPQCGNGVVESGEDCDGAAIGSCPTGPCAGDCTCPAPVCGNDVVESGEACDGSDDDACAGQCDSGCACPMECENEYFFSINAKSDANRFLFQGNLDNYSGVFDGLDPREGFRLVLSQGAGSVTADIPADDAGWASSKPATGKFKWSGRIGGIERVTVIDKSDSALAAWKVKVKGSNVPGAAAIDVYEIFDIQLTIDGVCNEDSY